jgi:thiamine biosynthesis lipoprotein
VDIFTKAVFPRAASASLAILCTGAMGVHSTHQLLYVFNDEGVLGTSLELKIAAISLLDAERARAAAIEEISRLTKILSAWEDNSEFSRWVQTFGQPVPVSRELFEVLGLFDKWRDRTGGALNAAAEVITRLWKAAEQQQRLPSPDELASAVGMVRQTHWQLDPHRQTATHLSDAPLSLSSFTKSYIAGHAADAALASPGVSGVVINIGGDLVVRGAWTEPVDIADPEADAENSPPLTRPMIHDRAVATSGSYRRGVEICATHYSHIVDPRTGMPCAEVIGSTVVARDPVDAGAMATAFSVLTPNDSAFTASIYGADFLLVKNDGEPLRSDGWGSLGGNEKSLEVATAAHPQISGGNAWDPSYELTVSVELAHIDERARRPYMAVWIEDQDKFPVRTLALWYNKDRFLPELRGWYHEDRVRSLAGEPDIAHSVSSATRPAGKYTLKWDGKDDTGKPVPAGKYTVFIEATREHGGYALLHQEVDFSGVPQTIPMQASSEVASAYLDYHKIKAQ